MSATTAKQEKERNAAFWSCRRGERTHVRIGQRRQDGTQITLIGTAAELHGPGGLCACCHGRRPQTPQPATAPDSGSARAPESRREGAVDTSRAAVAALIHPRIAHVRQYRGSDTVNHAAIRDAMRRFRPGRALTWSGAS